MKFLSFFLLVTFFYSSYSQNLPVALNDTIYVSSTNPWFTSGSAPSVPFDILENDLNISFLPPLTSFTFIGPNVTGISDSYFTAFGHFLCTPLLSPSAPTTYYASNDTNLNIIDSVEYVLCDIAIPNLCDTASVYVYYEGYNTFTFSSILSNDTLTCNSNCYNNIELLASNGTPPYLYSINSSTLSFNNIFEDLCPGTYFAMVVDDNSNSVFDTIVIDSAAFSIQENVSSVNCSSGSGVNSYIDINAYGGSGQYSYLWNTGFDSSYYLNPSDGNYNIIVTDDSTNCTVSTAVSFQGTECFSVEGNIITDENTNCQFDNNDYYLQNVWVYLTDTNGNITEYFDFVDSLGFYSISAPEGTYGFEFNGYDIVEYNLICPPASYNFTLDSSNITEIVDFYFDPPPPIQDVAVGIYELNPFVPGFSSSSRVIIYNFGDFAMNGNVVLEYDSLLSLSNANTGIIDAIARTITWPYSNLNPGDNQSFDVFYDSIPPSTMLGTLIYSSASVSPLATDSVPSNNTANLISTVIGSYDPNDKSVYPNGSIEPDVKTHSFHINFQNKGTYFATFVIVKDNLDDNLDLNTLRNVSASDNFVLTVENEDELVFTFNNIYLPAEQDDVEGSKGHIDFTIDQKENLPLGTEIENTAYIYFDFNEAIITNTTYNIIEEKTIEIGIDKLELEKQVSIYPNPSTGIFNIESEENNNVQSIQVYDLLGKLVFEAKEIDNEKAILNLSNTNNGIYLLKIETEKGFVTNRITVTKN